MHSVIYCGLGSLECFVIIKCTKFGQLILRKIIKIVATRCQILRLKCTKFDFGWGSTGEGKEGVRKKERGESGKGEGRGSIPLALILQFDHCPGDGGNSVVVILL